MFFPFCQPFDSNIILGLAFGVSSVERSGLILSGDLYTPEERSSVPSKDQIFLSLIPSFRMVAEGHAMP